ncbi:phosphatidylethanolamine-binding protein [Halteromyces radiatus]|uniref:phosphatidylethanolamine-binding protein n=1 Tax=Halteromyces radiatus TaxID=101107 RepID=UPI00221FDD68|nr:phosphatidylethanolamine-binding protein [Halteromyces radiatus]KAI8082728.1 phosphatidylethanolamine-binding protein [Halteromyces radiatus]
MPLFTFDMNMQHALKQAGIIPDVIDEGFQPKTLLSVKYPDEEVAIGNHLTTNQTAEAPQVQFVTEDNEDNEYTLFMVDPDAPSRTNPKNGPWRHWVAVNIPGNQQDKATAASSQLTNYLGPAPPPGTGDHRYVFLLYKQPNKNIKFESLSQSVQERRSFDYKKYALTHQLELVGVNFFYCSVS